MPRKVLIVDDSVSIRQMVSFTLKGAGFETDEAADGKAALDKAQGAPGAYDLVFTDQNMPLMDGLTLIRNLRAISKYQRTPILMLTTESGDDMKNKGREAGATGWLVKPFDPQKLLQVVAKVLP
ncbi:MAG: response regulator [Candidatus Dactylopiibacterium carminicum]|uniref:Response regulator n=1 Tax=Candidatus Dactylopiibacterium carminicum TaxID=857335 RepID=A0A272EPV4_9RHOO|nr:response regulator [Candidatus Dactylopiibacterium carminicum]KAF7598117.1 response regulator [Candidatus Dactylopiibacterium carminicum]PAS91740.1 MAG: response regulator [Candidatus Dactylopiibacterium carminicum]PAS94015.1 MAG: response regulator [Candidatus Dactylopiibacterium carminicum]PAS96677.1 MAG: response regulator [Candidatus Dactylopiibacterium carminicum]